MDTLLELPCAPNVDGLAELLGVSPHPHRCLPLRRSSLGSMDGRDGGGGGVHRCSQVGGWGGEGLGRG